MCPGHNLDPLGPCQRSRVAALPLTRHPASWTPDCLLATPILHGCPISSRLAGSARGKTGMGQRQTEADFDRLCWHDNTLYGFRIDVGDPDAGDWHTDLVLDIDHITDWICDGDGQCRFRVAPATLTFHDVTDLRVSVDSGDTGCRMSLQFWTIDAVTRERVTDQQVCLDRPYHRWRIALNWPQGGEIAFGASGFEQVFRAAPALMDGQWIPAAERG